MALALKIITTIISIIQTYDISIRGTGSMYMVAHANDPLSAAVAACGEDLSAGDVHTWYTVARQFC